MIEDFLKWLSRQVDRFDLAVLLGTSFLFYGFLQWSVGLAFIMAGLVILGFALIGALRG